MKLTEWFSHPNNELWADKFSVSFALNHAVLTNYYINMQIGYFYFIEALRRRWEISAKTNLFQHSNITFKNKANFFKK